VNISSEFATLPVSVIMGSVINSSDGNTKVTKIAKRQERR